MKSWLRPPDAPGPAPASDPADEPREEGTDLGAIRVHHTVMAEIARTAALAVPGVLEMSSSFAEGLASMVSKASFDRGVRVELEGQTVHLDLHLVLAFGVRIPQVAWRIQNEVRKAVADMTGKKIGQINVIVQGVRAPAPAPAGPGGGARRQEGGQPP